MYPMSRFVCASALLAAALLPGSALASSQDNNVEWFGISHFGWQDLRPLCPVDQQSFDVRVQAFQNDLTGVRVWVDDGSTGWVTASVQEQRGPYDVWVATIPSVAVSSFGYYIELTDGTDTDYWSPAGMSEDPPASSYTIDFATLSHAPYGATPLSGGGVVFRVWSPGTTSAEVRGEFNGWAEGDEMTRVGEDWVHRVPSATIGQQYKYRFDDSHWNTDPRARRLNASDNNNSYILDPFSYPWSVSDFDVPDFEEMVIYQLHVGTFAGGNGDPYGFTPFPSRYIDVAARADHLADLGVNCVMIMPVNEFPGDESAGYNPISNYAPEWKYGTPDEFKSMIDAFHERGIAVVLDIVWNHFSFSDNFMWFYDGDQIYFDDPALETPWGAQADFDNGNVRSYYLESAHQWLDHFKLDGFRMDATDFMNIPPQDGSGWSLMQALNDQVDTRWADKFIFAEQLPDDPFVTRPTSLGGAGFDAQYHDAFTDRLREVILTAASGDPEMWKIQNIVNGSGAFLNGRYVVNYVELHDETWPSSGGQRLVKTIDTTFPHDDIYAQGRTKLAQGIAFTAPGIPAMIMGTEWLESIDFGTSSTNRIDWEKMTTYPGIYQYYQDLIALRTSVTALRADSPHEVYRVDESANVIAYQRYDFGGSVAVVVANFSNNDYTSFRVGLPQPNSWTEVLNSQSAIYGGSGLDNPGTLTSEEIAWDGHPWSIELNLPAMGFVVLMQGDTSDIPGIGDGTGDGSGGVGDGIGDGSGAANAGLRLRAIQPNPAQDGTSVRFALASASEVTVEVFASTGRLVGTIFQGSLGAGEHAIEWNGLDADG
ncbi:MAG: alpha amylase C-terminal domain-containing protein, partial [Candidatus Eisenbacteria bacterium]|nr:alpha amylase C-terminal domain-containing protein [Candidatus Eisenbacteria bacterium]